jgi:hypothetical protein
MKEINQLKIMNAMMSISQGKFRNKDNNKIDLL